MTGRPETWQGTAALYEATSGRTIRVRANVTRAAIEAVSEGDMAPPTRLGRDAVRHADRTADGSARIRFREPEGVALTFDGPESLERLRELGWIQPAAARGLAELRGLVIAGVAILAALILAGRFAMGPLADAVARLAPAGFEASFGRAVYASFTGSQPEGRPAPDPAAILALTRCVEALEAPVEGAADPGAAGGPVGTRFPITATIVEDPAVVNAFALPGGYVVVYRGLLDLMDDESQLLGVLAHELGHVHERHAMRRLARSAASRFLIAAISGSAGGGAGLAQQGRALASLAYDRDDERAADDHAIRTLAGRGFDPRGLARLFEAMDARVGAGDRLAAAAPAMLSTHPRTKERIARLLAAAPDGSRTPRRLLSGDEWKALTRTPAGAATPPPAR